jgi:L-seryl-tRNA(Ser) seleniumtransferase
VGSTPTSFRHIDNASHDRIGSARRGPAGFVMAGPMLTSRSGARRELPSVDRVLRLAPFAALAREFGRPLLLEALRAVLAGHRARLAGEAGAAVPDDDALALECARRLQALTRPSLRPVFNLTGTVLHTNLGRALYPATAIEAATLAMARPVNVEYDVEGGGRGERDAHVESWLTRLTGAQAAAVVNNNAAAVYLTLNTLAAGREVIVSRGELVEIGGSFRIPDIMASSGCVLREVGTTNRTHASDYESAIGERTAALMKVHTSNYQIRGFTSQVKETDLARIAQSHGLPLINDLGSGMLVDLEAFGLPHEPTPHEAIEQGADIVTFSGDKLLGGPQCGLIAGRRDLIERIRTNPMKRALRLDKVRLAALEAVLRLYADPEQLKGALPALRLLTRGAAEIAAQAQRLLPQVAGPLSTLAQVDVVDCASQIGSGALPVETLASAGLRLVPAADGGGVDGLAASLRALPVPVVGRIHEGALILDLRCLEVSQEQEFVAQLQHIEGRPESP